MTDTVTVEERYQSACKTSNLRCETRDDAPLGDVSVMIAAGWSHSRIGAALMRLHTKADRTALEQVHHEVTRHAERCGIERPVVVAAAVLSWWLSHICGTCKGVKFELIPGTPALSSRHCRACKGLGDVAIPHGQAGRQLANWLDDCKRAAAESISKRLRFSMGR